MQQEYNNLNKIGDLLVDNSNLNQASILQELKNHQEWMEEWMEQNLEINMTETLTGLCGKMENKKYPIKTGNC